MGVATHDILERLHNNAPIRTRARVTYSIANLRGITISGANKMKQSAKQTSAPMLQPAKMSIRSHRVTEYSERGEISMEQTGKRGNFARSPPS